MINLDLPWNPAVLEQRIGRVYRLGQKKPIDVFNLVSEQGIESRISVLVDTKQAFFKGLFDGDTETVRFAEASSFMTRIQKLIDPSAIAVVAARGGQAEAEADRGEADDDDLDINDEVVDPIDEMIDAADEARDTPPAPPSASRPAAETAPSPVAALAPASQAEPGDDHQPDGADSTATPVSTANGTAPSGTSPRVRDLFSQLQVRREPSGKVIIEAPGRGGRRAGGTLRGHGGLASIIRAGAT